MLLLFSNTVSLMTTCLGKSCSFGFLLVSFVNVFVCAPFSFRFSGWILDQIVLIPGHCLSIYFGHSVNCACLS